MLTDHPRAVYAALSSGATQSTTGTYTVQSETHGRRSQTCSSRMHYATQHLPHPPSSHALVTARTLRSPGKAPAISVAQEEHYRFSARSGRRPYDRPHDHSSTTERQDSKNRSSTARRRSRQRDTQQRRHARPRGRKVPPVFPGVYAMTYI